MKRPLFLKAAAAVIAVCCCLLSSMNSFAQNKSVSGTVVDQNGQPVIGASVMLVGNNRVGTVTDLDGKFTLSVPAGANLSVSSIGYTTETVAVGDQSVLNITIAEDTEMIEETVVIGYGVQKKSDLTGSVASVKESDMRNRSTSDAAAALQGKAAGVQIFNASGAPGSGSSIRVRGISSNSGSGLGPLLIVDGLKVDNIQYLDPSMIESMEVLKDAASAAIYGAQAGNGVILITTKSGAKSKDGLVFYNYKLSISSLGHHAEVMNAEQYIDWQHMANPTFPNTKEELIKAGYWDGVSDTNWANVLYGTGVTQNHTFGAQGGNDRGSYYISINNVDENGMARGDQDYYKRFTAQVNGDYKIKKWFTVGTNTSIEKYSQQMIGEHSEYAGSGAGLLGTMIIDPLTPIYFKSYEDLSLGMKNAIQSGIKVYGPADHPDWYYSTSQILEGDGINPLIYRDRNQNKKEGWNIRGTVYANLTPFKGFTFTSRLGYRIAQSYSSNYEEPFYVNAKAYSNTYSISATSSQNYYYQWENFGNWNKTFGKHDIGVMAGMSYTYSDNRSVGASLNGTDPLKGYAENFRYLSQDNGSGTKGISGGTPSESAQISYFGRLTYSYDSRYSLQANFRADAFDSSKLSPKNRWGYFPSISAGWTISNESWFKDNIDRNLINFLKVRGSWGINGNIAVLSGYPYSTSISYNSQSYQFSGSNNELTLGSIPDGLANPNLTWETSVQTDLGLDLRMLNNRLTFGFDWFNKDTRDLLVNISPVSEVGISSTTVNAGSINNRGLEFELGWQDNIGDFGYSINGNISTLKNKVTYLEPSVGHITGSGFANYKLETYFQEGYPVWYFRGFDYVGIGENGEPDYLDANGELTQHPVDADLKYIGSSLPPVTFGLTLHMDWKGLDLTVFGSGAAGHQLVPCVYRTQHFQINSLTWYYENAGKTIPGIDRIWDDVDFWSSSATLFKGDYFKIKQIQLGYTLPKAWLSKIKLNDLRIYTSLDDWFVFTDYPGFDPETASTGSTSGSGLDKGSYPNAKRLLFGVNISF